MPLVTRNHVTESSSATQTIPIPANAMIQRALGGCGASEGKSGMTLLSQGSSQIFSMVTAHKTPVSSQVRLSVSDFRMGGWKCVEAICSLCTIRDIRILMQINFRLQPKIKFKGYDFQQY